MANKVQGKARSSSVVTDVRRRDSLAVLGRDRKGGQPRADKSSESLVGSDTDTGSAEEAKQASSPASKPFIPSLNVRWPENPPMLPLLYPAPTPSPAPSTTASTTTATTEVARKLDFSIDGTPRKARTPASMRHAMPDRASPVSYRSSPGSAARPGPLASTPRTRGSSTASAPSSPRRASGSSSPRPAPTPRSRPSAPGTPGAIDNDAAQRNFDLALSAANAIAHTKGMQNRFLRFQSVLSLTAAVAPAARGPLLAALAKVVHRLPDADRNACIAELRELAADMSREFRKDFLQMVLDGVIRTRDDDTDSSSSSPIRYKAAVFEMQFAKHAARAKEVASLLESPLTEKSLRSLARLLKTNADCDSDRRVILMVIDALDQLPSNGPERLLELFAKAGIDCADVFAALMHSVHGKAIQDMATRNGMSVAVLYQGVLTGDGMAIQKLLRILNRIALPAALHVYLAEEFGRIRRSPPQPTTSAAAASRLVLFEMIAISDMPEVSRCVLLHAVKAASSDRIHKALTDSVRADKESIWNYAHRMLAAGIDIGACFTLGENTDDGGADLASYREFVGKLMQNQSVKAIVKESRICSARQLRALMLEQDDIDEFVDAVCGVLRSDLAYDDKLALLKCETAPVGDSVAVHVAEAGYKTALKIYLATDPARVLDNDLAYNVVAGDEKKFRTAYQKLTKNFDTGDLAEIRTAQENAMRAAQHSRLPGLHVAAITGRAGLLAAYLQAVADFSADYSREEVAGLLALSQDGIPLFNNVTRMGTAKDIEACMTAILDADLPEASKVALLKARTQPYKIGAFYLLMSCGDEARAMAFVKGVLQTSRLQPESRIALLQCNKRSLPAEARPGGKLQKALEESAATARAEALRKKHGALVAKFDFEVERSDALDAEQKRRLQTG